MPKEGEPLVEVRAHSEGGDGAVVQVEISSSLSGKSLLFVFHYIANSLSLSVSFFCYGGGLSNLKAL